MTWRPIDFGKNRHATVPHEQTSLFDRTGECRACIAARNDPEHKIVQCAYCYREAELDAIKEHGGG